MIILGLNYNHPCASAAFIVDGEVAFALAEERLNRVKYYGGFPKLAIIAGLKHLNIKINDIDYVAIGRSPSANKLKKVSYALNHPLLLKDLLKIKGNTDAFSFDAVKNLLRSECGFSQQDCQFEVLHVEHHVAHIASSYFTSNWQQAAGISIDGSGDFVTCMFAECVGNQIKPIHRIYVPQSLGSFYFTGCQFLGYQRYGDEGKVMGLAPYGKDVYGQYFDEMIAYEKGNLMLNQRYFKPFGAHQGLKMLDDGTFEAPLQYTQNYLDIFGQPRDPHSTDFSQRDKDFAFGLQKRFEAIYFALFNDLHRRLPLDHVVMAGGCALNSVANGQLLSHTPFKASYAQSAPADDGLAVGAALYAAHAQLGIPRKTQHDPCYLGQRFDDDAVQSVLQKKGIAFERIDDQHALLQKIAALIAQGLVIGCFRGRSEWGPRALGHRSILAHPGFPNMKDILNARIKKRESFRPFAPSVLAERMEDIFENPQETPFMLHVYHIKKAWRDKLSAVCHHDHTGRVQTVSRQQNPFYHALISEFEQKTGIPVLLNTSFNENEPVVETPEEAVNCFLRTKMDVLFINQFVCQKMTGNHAKRGVAQHCAEL